MREQERKMWDVVKKAKPYVAMVSLQFGYAGSYIIAAISLKHGTSHFVLVVYRLAFATATVTPFAIVLDRSLSLSLMWGTFEICIPISVSCTLVQIVSC